MLTTTPPPPPPPLAGEVYSVLADEWDGDLWWCQGHPGECGGPAQLYYTQIERHLCEWAWSQYMYS